jgi:hypothetical protein
MSDSMKIYELFSKRQADAARSGQADVYQYDKIPSSLRIQIDQIALEAIGLVGESAGYRREVINNEWWAEIERLYRREKGLDDIGTEEFAGERILGFMRECDTEEWLDLLEVISVAIGHVGQETAAGFRHRWQVKINTEDAIDEINYRLRQAGVGYQVEESRLIRIDSQYVHAEIVKPALALLSGGEFEGARQEFRSAHQHYRAGEHRQAVAMAANALESTFKSIFEQKGWPYNRSARISDLIKVARAKHLWPDYLDTSFDQLVATLQNGLPKIRDNDAAHGQGAKAKDVPGYIAAYALHLAACKIVFIVEAAKGHTASP